MPSRALSRPGFLSRFFKFLQKPWLLLLSPGADPMHLHGVGIWLFGKVAHCFLACMSACFDLDPRPPLVCSAAPYPLISASKHASSQPSRDTLPRGSQGLGEAWTLQPPCLLGNPTTLQGELRDRHQERATWPRAGCSLLGCVPPASRPFFPWEKPSGECAICGCFQIRTLHRFL